MKVLSSEPQIQFWEIYKGNTISYFKGKIIGGSSILPLFVSLSLVNGGLLTFYIRVPIDEILLIITIVLHITSVILMIKTALCDPGIIHKIQRNYQSFQEQYLIPAYVRYDDAVLIVNSHQSYELKYCDSCLIYKPLQTAHCRKCDNCIQNFDHHCIWLGQCIGRRNYRSFYMFISALSATLLLVEFNLIVVLLETNWEYYIYLAINSGFLIFVLYLLILHTYLSFQNMSTYDYITTNKFVKDYYAEYFEQGEGAYQSRKWIRYAYNIYTKLNRGIRCKFYSFNQYIYCEASLTVRRQIVHFKIVEQQNIQFKKAIPESETNNSKCDSILSQSDPKQIVLDAAHRQVQVINEVENESKVEDVRPITEHARRQQYQFGISQSQNMTTHKARTSEHNQYPYSMQQSHIKNKNNFQFQELDIEFLNQRHSEN